jgi:hypothetical protein
MRLRIKWPPEEVNNMRNTRNNRGNGASAGFDPTRDRAPVIHREPAGLKKP